jgi:ATP-binding cassette subfamily G (WHITE) protein 2 (PDR)
MCHHSKLLTGISSDVMHTEFRGECNYQAESDIHFPHLTVTQTLHIPALSRTPAHDETVSNRKNYIQTAVESTASAIGLTSVLAAKVGNSFIRGISGGERQRVSLAEVLLCETSLQCWDNSTRGLDSANSLNFIRRLRSSCQVAQSTHVVSIYQASQDIYDVFDKVVLLYEGYQIFFGPIMVAKTYFTNLGFVCPTHTTTSDFLTSLTNPAERRNLVRPGFGRKVPRNAVEFASMWKESSLRADLIKDINRYNSEFAPCGDRVVELRGIRNSRKSRGLRPRSPYTVAFQNQVWLCLKRGFQRLVNDLAPPISAIAGNAILSIILGSIFYNMQNDTKSFFGRGVLIFFAVLTNTFLGAFEGVQLWDQRPIVEKHYQYALYHPSAEAVASMFCDIPNKVLLTTFFNIPFYFLANMRRSPAAFFTFYLFAFVSLLTGSMLFRTIGAMSKTLTSSIAPGADFILLLVIFTRFVLLFLACLSG